jgi:hypothetical protein
VLACLHKDPNRRPQSAAELRRLVEACRVEPWDSASARAWWTEHQPDLDDAVQSTGEARTIAIDGAHRTSVGADHFELGRRRSVRREAPPPQLLN